MKLTAQLQADVALSRGKIPVRIEYKDKFVVNDQRDVQFFFYVFIYIFNSLHVLSTSCSSSGDTNCVNTTSSSCYSVSVAVHLQLSEVVLTQFVSPDD